MQAPASLTRRLRQAALAAAALALAGTALANDRPFESARTAVAEDDAQSWSFEAWTRRVGSLRSLSAESEYVFGDGKSLQFELSRSLDRRGADTGHEAEVEYKHLFNDIARDGWGLGASVALGVERLHGSGHNIRTVTLRLPLSLDMGQFLDEPRRGPLLHLNAAVTQTQGSRRVWAPALALEQPLPGRSTLFAEVAREGADKLGQVGLRHWLRREKLALDIAWQQRRGDGDRSSGWVAGIGWYDL